MADDSSLDSEVTGHEDDELVAELEGTIEKMTERLSSDEKDVAALARLEADENTDALTIKRKRNAIASKRTKARKKASLDKARRRVALLKIRVEALEEELRAPASA